MFVSRDHSAEMSVPIAGFSAGNFSKRLHEEEGNTPSEAIQKRTM